MGVPDLRFAVPDLPLGKTRKERCLAYRAFVDEGIGEGELEKIRTALQRNQLTGNERFRNEIAARTGRRISARGRGRPKKPRDESQNASK
jgi:putative transposase